MAWTPVNDGQTPNWSTNLPSKSALDSVFGFGAFCEAAMAGSVSVSGTSWDPTNDTQTPNWVPVPT